MNLRCAPLVTALIVLPFTSACGARSPLSDQVADALDAVTCVADPADDPCGPSIVVPAECDTDAGTCRCPDGARVYERAVDEPEVCLPFSGPESPFLAVGAWGLGGSFTRVPTGDGRCLWVAESVTTATGQTVSNVAIEVDRHAAFGSCPATGVLATGSLSSIVSVTRGADPSLHVQLASAFRTGGVTRVAYRLFREDPSVEFGVVDLGGGLGMWDDTSQRIVVDGPDAIAFPTSVDLGTAAVAWQGSGFVWGCPRNGGFLVSDCILARFDGSASPEVFLGGAAWSADLEEPLAATTGLKSGPWVSSVTPDADSGGLLHTFIGGFGSQVQTQLAAAPTGPWTSPATLLSCDLPSEDTKSYCAGPAVHPELTDPTRPGEVVVSYEIGTTAANQGSLVANDPAGYWPRLVWTSAP